MRALLFPLFLLVTSCASHTIDDDDEIAHLSLPVLPKTAESTQNSFSHVLYLIQSKKTQEAIDALFALKERDPYLLHGNTLEQLGLALLEQGAKSSDPQDLLTCLYGVGISQDARTLHIAEQALSYDDPQLQLVAVSVLASFDTESSVRAIEEAMKSNYLSVRFEAAYWLSVKRAKSAHGQLVSLLSKVDPDLHALFPRLFAMEASPSSDLNLRHLLLDVNEDVRREAIIAAGHFRRDDLVDEIRTLAKEPSPVQQEACAFALAAIGDEASRAQILKLAASHTLATKIAGCKALAAFGDLKAKAPIIDAARAGDCFAISAMSSFEGDHQILYSLLQHEDVNVRANAAIALLEQKDARCRQTIADLLIDSHRDYTIQSITSHGGSLHCIKVTPSSEQALKAQPHLFEISLRLRHELLALSLELPEYAFLDLAKAIFDSRQYDLIPLTVRLLENLQSEQAIALLKEQEQRLGAPYVRAWCCLGLYRLRQEGPYAETIVKMIEKHEEQELFRARPILPWKLRKDESRYQLSLEESCALLIESFEALAERQDEKAIELLLRAIRNGNVHNRYTLAGLLMRASL